MNIESYRGPGKAGGVSPALDLLMSGGNGNHQWFYLDANRLFSTAGGAEEAIPLPSIPKEIVEGHYRYCNEFLWPIMHDLPQHAVYRSQDRTLYERFNRKFARDIMPHVTERIHFVQDYQLALLPQEFGRRGTTITGVFWHIPWPKSVPDEFLAPIIDIAKGLLSADVLGFHTREYAVNFLNFVARHLDSVSCSYDSLVVQRDGASKTVGAYIRPYYSHTAKALPEGTAGSTTIVVGPLGLDWRRWAKLARSHSKTVLHKAVVDTDYVLSVDRCDYTKGVLNRAQGIDCFFEKNPDFKKQITFMQVLVKTRTGIDAYDRHWLECQQKVAAVNDKHGVDGWQPIMTVEGPLDSSELSLLYSNASVLLVNPVRDGLNLTAKEFVACQVREPGVLALSPYCGAWDELGEFAVEVNPYSPEHMSNGVLTALTMPRAERAERIAKLQWKVRRNGLNEWCSRFYGQLKASASTAVEPALQGSNQSGA